MTNGQSLADGRLGDDELAWLARRADGGFGMIATCAAHVSRDGKAWPGELAVDRDELVLGTRATRGAVAVRRSHGDRPAVSRRRAGGVGADRRAGVEREHVARGVAELRGAAGRRPSADIERVIGDFAAAAARAKAAGFDGVELHGAHGYLLTQFLSTVNNTRTDDWGGPLEHRARLVREVMRAVRARVGPAFTVGVRLSLEQGGHAKGLDLDESLQVVRWLADDGADFIHASLWRADAMTRKRPEQHPIPLARAALPRDVALIACGAIWTAAEAHAALERGADMIALARAAIINPDWPKHVVAPGWEPRRPPLTRAELLELSVSPPFGVHYLKAFKNLVAD